MTSQITQILKQMREGDESALEKLIPLVYNEMRRMAAARLRSHPPEHTLQPTALVNEAYLKLFAEARPQFADRTHLLAVLSRVMRQVLVDHARAKGAAKRGGDGRRVEWDRNIELEVADGGRQWNLLELDDALAALAREKPALVRLIEMHYFGGMTAEEAAVSLGRSADAVRHDLRLARAWLRRELAEGAKGA